MINSRTTGSGLALLALEAAELATQGRSLSEITALVNYLIPRINFLSTRDTLLYLDKGGRIFEAKPWAEAESVASFRAIVEIDARSEGITKPVARAKTRKQIMEKILEIAEERIKNSRLHVFSGHARAPEEAEDLKRTIQSRVKCAKV
jgi:DegV family protein with EDD domain